MPKGVGAWAPGADALAHAVLLVDWKQSAAPCPEICVCGIMPNLSSANPCFYCRENLLQLWFNLQDKPGLIHWTTHCCWLLVFCPLGIRVLPQPREELLQNSPETLPSKLLLLSAWAFSKQ